MIGLRSSQLIADSSISAYYSGVCYLLGFYGSVCLSVSSFPCLLAHFFHF